MSRTHTVYLLASRISNPADLLQLLPYLYFICAHWDTTGHSLDGLGIEYRWGEFSTPFQTSPGSQRASCTMGT